MAENWTCAIERIETGALQVRLQPDAVAAAGDILTLSQRPSG